MFMRKFLDLSGFKNLTGLALLLATSTVSAVENTPQLGKPAPQSLEKAWNLDIFPNGAGLPIGSGTAIQGKKIYQQYCLSCHGVDGTGDSAEELAGAKHGLTDSIPDKTIGTYWPYATTIFDFTRRAMPLNAPGILNNNQLYAVTAYLLYLNHLIKETEMINATTLPKVKMPNRNGFISG